MKPNETQAPRPKVNRRRAIRKQPKGSTRALAYLNALGLGPNIAMRILDLSETGIRLVVKQELKVGQEFEVDFEGPGHPAVKLLATVVWVVPTADEQFCVGAAFAKAVDYAVLMAMTRG